MGSLAPAVTIALAAYRYREARDAALRTWRDIDKGDRARDTREFSEEIQVAEISPPLRHAARSLTRATPVKNHRVELPPELLQNILLSLRRRRNPIR